MARIVPTETQTRLGQLTGWLEACLAPERPGFARRLSLFRRMARTDPVPAAALAELEQAMAASRAKRQQRVARLPALHFDSPLPVVARREEIARLLSQHQVLVLSGETGSGKTTQLPKICLSMGRGSDGLIGVTQPRRIAARSVANYLAHQMQSEVGELVGCKVRFHDRTGPDTLVKIMTDGILLAEIPGDRLLMAYDTLIIDEAHERNLNIDFILGYLKPLLPRRPDLKVIISSATLDTGKFSQHFDQAPILEVAGRTYPVEVRYRPVEAHEEGEIDLPLAVTEAVRELVTLGPDGDILVFLPGEREIRESAEALRKRHPPGVEVLPLFSRLSSQEQDRIFQPASRRRIILATNVAETSLTVPGIRYVVDSGLARLAQYNPRLKVQRLPIERVSKASADQRKGRCGRLGPGVCIRLYAEEDFQQRVDFTPPEVLRASLAAVILRMKELGLGEAQSFPFVDPPLPRAIREGVKLLQELGALDSKGHLTAIGSELARLPVDPRLGRIILAARDLGCLKEVLVLTAALSIQDPRERPQESREAADTSHKRFQDESSDFLGLLNLWHYVEEGRFTAKSGTAFRRQLRQEHLSVVRVLEWREIHQQLTLLVKGSGMRVNEVTAPPVLIHKALLAGLAANIGVKDDRAEGYLGPHGMRFHIFPGSALHKGGARWVVAAEFMETSRLFALTCGRVDPEWIEEMAAPLCRRSHTDPYWDRRSGQVMAYQKVTLHGLPLVTGRRVPYGPVDPVVARQIFIQSALIEGEWHHKSGFYRHNAGLIREVQGLEARSRRRDLLVQEEEIYRFYDERVPPGIYDITRFEKWLQQEERRHPNCLRLSRDTVMQRSADELKSEAYPGHLVVKGHEIPLIYHFEPGNDHDGITARIPLPILSELPVHVFEWLVPGMLEEKIAACLKCLPGGLRKHFVPIPKTAQQCRQELAGPDEPLLAALTTWLARQRGVVVPAEAWKLADLPPHLCMNFQVLDPRTGAVAGQGRDLAAIRDSLQQESREILKALPPNPWQRKPVTAWDFGVLPEQVALAMGKTACQAYPGLRDEAGVVALVLFPTLADALAASRAGLRRLFLLHLVRQAQQLRRNLPVDSAMRLAHAPLGNENRLRDDLLDLGAEWAFFPESEPWMIRRAEVFQDRLARGRTLLDSCGRQAATLVREILMAYHQASQLLREPAAPQLAGVAAEARAHLATLVYPGYLLATPRPWIQHLPRYLQAITLRLERRAREPAKDDRKWQEFLPYWQRWQQVLAKHPDHIADDLIAYRWLLEELRVSLFAQELRTAMPVSTRRLDEKWREMVHWHKGHR